ncbi:MAG: hypothetical protein K8963_05755 [Proteobacteria bacterium]|nr:hypothetical protein [Pseudomonadota bacterium]
MSVYTMSLNGKFNCPDAFASLGANASLKISVLAALLVLSSCGGGSESNASIITDSTNTTALGDVNSTGFAMRMDRRERVVSVEIGAQGYADASNRRGNYSTSIPQRIYEVFKDDFDFITLLYNQVDRAQGSGPFGSFRIVQSNVKGIGQDTPSNKSATYGSDGKLKGVLSLFTVDSLTRGPALHELAHCCANYVIPFTGDESLYAVHWGYSGGSSAGQLGGFTQSSLVVNTGELGPNSPQYIVDDFGLVANGGNSVPYNELELYLMGFIPATQVQPFDVFTGISGAVRDVSRVATGGKAIIGFNATKREQWTIERIVAEHGARLPSAAESQKDFTMLVVLVSAGVPTDEQFDTADEGAENIGRNQDDGNPRYYSFWEATGGRGTMRTNELRQALK